MSWPVRALLVVLVLTAGCSGGDEAGYDDEFEDEFLDACQEAYGRPEAPQVCGCWYDQVENQIAFDELPAIDDLVADDFDTAPTRMPGEPTDRPIEILAACARQVGGGPLIGTAIPAPTMPRPPTTTTTPTTVPG